jgi:metallo-beta-lactamase family protein
MEITFIGAARTVTGSMHLIKANHSTFLLDCGLYQGKRKEAFEINRTFNYFDPEEIDFVILSHAHIDHSGNLPSLVKKGFSGKIYSTFASMDLSTIMLKDSAHVQLRDVEYVNKKRAKKKQNLFELLYNEDDVERTIKLFEGINYHHEVEITPGINLTFYDAGHILGSAITFLSIKENGTSTNIGFTGDLGRPNLPILKDPEKIPDCDLLICESTYGAKEHENPKDAEKKLAEVVRLSIRRKSKIIIPAFSVGRTQEIVYALHRIFESGELERIPVYVDSPLAVNATNVFRNHPECFDSEISQYLINHEDPFGFNKLKYITDVEDSKKLNNSTGPSIIISSSGMCEAGRIQHHLANSIENPNNIVLMVGYAAENTLGRKIINKSESVNIFGETYKLNAEVIVMDSLSAHADKNELLNYCSQFDKSRMQNIFLVHGELEQQEPFRTSLKSLGFQNILIPNSGDKVNI